MAGGQDVAFVDVGTLCPDLKIVNGDLQADDGLENAVLISLFSDRFVPESELPANIFEKRGWWADGISDFENDFIGSRLWTFNRAKLTQRTTNDIRDAVIEALQWLIEDGIADSINVVTTLVQSTRIDIDVEILRPEGDDIPFKFVWDGQELKVG